MKKDKGIAPNNRDVDYNTGLCALCGGTHYGSARCPYRCADCGVNTNPCTKENCARDAYDKEQAADKYEQFMKSIGRRK